MRRAKFLFSPHSFTFRSALWYKAACLRFLLMPEGQFA